MTLSITRDSVSAGDDVLAPHKKIMRFEKSISLREIIEKIIAKGYIPQVTGGSNWRIIINGCNIGDVKFFNKSHSLILHDQNLDELNEIHFQYDYETDRSY